MNEKDAAATAADADASTPDAVDFSPSAPGTVPCSDTALPLAANVTATDPMPPTEHPLDGDGAEERVAVPALFVTVGAGRRHPEGRRFELSAADPVGSMNFICQVPRAASLESWISLHSFEKDYRTRENWRSAAGVGVDIDYHDFTGAHSPVDADLVERAMGSVTIGNIVHATPRGYRVFVIFSRPITDANRWNRIALGVGAVIEGDLRRGGLLANLSSTGKAVGSGFAVDRPVLTDRARLLFTPLALVEGIKRNAEVRIIRQAPYHV